MNDANALSKLTSFLEDLSQKRISYTLAYCREDSILVSIAVPGERWEVEFFANCDVEVERFVSTGRIDDESALAELFRRFSD